MYFQAVFSADPVGDAVPGSELAGHKAGPRWTAYGAGGVAVGKDHPPTGDMADIGSFIIFAAHAAQVGVARIIDEDKNDIGFVNHFTASGDQTGEQVEKRKGFKIFHDR